MTDDYVCDDNACEILVSPLPSPKPRSLPVSLAPRARRVIFVNSGKPNSTRILDGAAAFLRERGVEIGESVLKPRSGRTLDDPTLDRLAREDALILSAVND